MLLWVYNAHRNFCASLVRKTKKEYFGNIYQKKISDNKTFWKTILPFLTNKEINKNNINL